MSILTARGGVPHVRNITFDTTGIDVDVSHALDGTTGLYNQNIIVEELNTGTVTLSLNLQLLGFYWNRHERDILSFSMA